MCIGESNVADKTAIGVSSVQVVANPIGVGWDPMAVSADDFDEPEFERWKLPINVKIARAWRNIHLKCVYANRPAVHQLKYQRCSAATLNERPATCLLPINRSKSIVRVQRVRAGRVITRRYGGKGGRSGVDVRTMRPGWCSREREGVRSASQSAGKEWASYEYTVLVCEADELGGGPL